MFRICVVCSCCVLCRNRLYWLLSRIVVCIRVVVCCICLVWMLIVVWLLVMLFWLLLKCRFCVIRFICFWCWVVVGR